VPIDFHRTFVNDESFIRGAARILYAGSTISFPAKIGDVINLSTFDPQTGWLDLGATKTGIQIIINNDEENFDVDQIMGELASQPTNWTCAVATQFAELTLDRLSMMWEGGAVILDASITPNEKEMGFGLPTSYTQRRLAVLFQRPNGKIRGYFFRKVQRSPQESSLSYMKTGEQQTIPMRFTCLADTSITDPYRRFFIARDQQ
jgi:hypothetical protein